MHQFKAIKLFCAGAALSLALTVPAVAANEACADRLHDLGLFQGTEAGYDLERAPTRAEAAVMLVRLLGAETQAQGLAYDAPFADLDAWQQPYVQYLYENGLTTGATATTFEPEQPCSAQMYAAFLLRALGFSEQAGDFSYAQAIDKAAAHGVYDVEIDTARFWREDVTEASYTALAAAPKEEDGTLLDRLVAQGAVETAAAAPYQALFAQYAQYRAAVDGMDALTHFSVNTTLRSGALTPDGQTAVAVSAQETAVFDLEAAAVRTDRTTTLSAAGVDDKTQSTISYLADGALHRRTGGVWSQAAVPADAQARLLRAYGRVPLSEVGTIARAAGAWTIGLDRMSDRYRELTWAASAMGVFDDPAEAQSVTVQQTVRNDRIASQQLTVTYARGSGVWTSTLDRTGEGALLTPPV